MSDENLIGKFRTPLTPEMVRKLEQTVDEYPNHVVSVEAPFLVLRFPEESA